MSLKIFVRCNRKVFTLFLANWVKGKHVSYLLLLIGGNGVCAASDNIYYMSGALGLHTHPLNVS